MSRQEQAGMPSSLPHDPLWQYTPTPFGARYYVLGIPLDVVTNAPTLAELAAETFGVWEGPDPSACAEAVRLHLFLQDRHEPAPVDVSTLHTRIQAGDLLLTVGQSLGFGHRGIGIACAFMTPALLANRSLAQICFVETLGMYLVCRYRRATLHAAAIVEGGRCVLLTGNDGAGKSTLAYACLRAGLGLLAEDIVYADLQAEDVVAWGVPWHLHLLPDTVRFFPELAHAERIQQFHGETKLRIRTRELRPEAAIPCRPVEAVLSLGRAEGATSHLRPADPAHVRQALTHFKGAPDLDLAAMQVAVDRLLAGRIAHLEVGSDLSQAVTLLRQWLEGDKGGR
jgi:hypothetical protein